MFDEGDMESSSSGVRGGEGRLVLPGGKDLVTGQVGGKLLIQYHDQVNTDIRHTNIVLRIEYTENPFCILSQLP